MLSLGTMLPQRPDALLILRSVLSCAMDVRATVAGRVDVAATDQGCGEFVITVEVNSDL